MHGMVWTLQQCLVYVLVQSYSRKADHRPDLMGKKWIVGKVDVGKVDVGKVDVGKASQVKSSHAA